MKLKKIISVLSVLSLVLSFAFGSASAAEKTEGGEGKDAYKDSAAVGEMPSESQSEPSGEAETTVPSESDELHQYEPLKNELAAELLKAEGCNKDEFTAESFEAMEKAAQNAGGILDNWEKLFSKAGSALEELKNALGGLVSYRDLLAEAVQEGQQITSEWYTEDSFKALEKSLEKGRAVLEKDRVTEDDAEGVIEEIQAARDALYNIKDRLKLAVKEAKAKFSLTYREDSFEEFKAEIERLEKSITDDLTADEVKKLTEEVINSHKLLKPVLGDTNVSGEITVEDATAVQRYLCRIDLNIEPTVSDVNFDNKIDIKDVTEIQKYSAGVIDKFEEAPHVPDYTAKRNLVLVNYKYPIKSGYVPEMRAVSGNSSLTFDVRAADALEKMLSDCRAEGLSPIICSAYRSESLQEQLFSNKVAYYTNMGYNYEKASDLAKTSVAYPGTSEHQLGLAADIVSVNYQVLDEGQLKTAEQQWLMKNCWKYGFILRYPTGKQDITGVIFEPWHYRYVGVEAAKEITEKGITLEEYLGLV